MDKLNISWKKCSTKSEKIIEKFIKKKMLKALIMDREIVNLKNVWIFTFILVNTVSFFIYLFHTANTQFFYNSNAGVGVYLKLFVLAFLAFTGLDYIIKKTLLALSLIRCVKDFFNQPCYISSFIRKEEIINKDSCLIILPNGEEITIVNAKKNMMSNDKPLTIASFRKNLFFIDDFC